MSTFRIQPHGRLQEWVAQEKGYFEAEGLEYEFVWGSDDGLHAPSVQSTDAAPAEVKMGALESMESGRACEVSSACHWMVNMAASAEHGVMWGHGYTVSPCGIFVPPGSTIRRPEDLANVEIGVGYHSGSHFTTMQALLPILGPDEISLSFIGGPADRIRYLAEGKVPAATVFGMQYYIAEQMGCRRVLDTTFMIGFLAPTNVDSDDLARYFRALQRAQRDIDLAPEQFKHYYLKELDEHWHDKVDVRAFGTGERYVAEKYTREMYEATHSFTLSLNTIASEQLGPSRYATAVLA
ncbi:MAG: ABC transporter substrate-binding protein [Chloroflexota bacterium]